MAVSVVSADYGKHNLNQFQCNAKPEKCQVWQELIKLNGRCSRTGKISSATRHRWIQNEKVKDESYLGRYKIHLCGRKEVSKPIYFIKLFIY